MAGPLSNVHQNTSFPAAMDGQRSVDVPAMVNLPESEQTNMKTTDLQFKNETSDKTYTVAIDGLEVLYIFGKREGTKTTMFQIADDKAEARQLHDDCVKGLLKKGYTLAAGSVAPKTPTDIAEFRRAAALKAWATMRANGIKPAEAKVKRSEPMTAEERSDAAKRAWITIRANREAAAKAVKAEARAAKKLAKVAA
jgi:predicted DNA-binding WGR domain protein